MISITSPTALAFALLALPIIGLYILKVRLRRVPVSTNLFWNQVYDEKPPRTIWQNFRHLISLLAQLLLLLLLVLAVADPFFSWQKNASRRIVLILDCSASMQVSSNGTTRMQEAVAQANTKLDGIRENDQISILLADQTPKVLVGMTGHIPTLRRALSNIVATDNTTHIQPSIELAQQLIGNHPHGEIVVYTDGGPRQRNATALVSEEFSTSQDDSMPSAIVDHQVAISQKPKPSRSAPVSWQIVGTSSENIGIVQFQARRSLSDIVGYEILVKVLNATDQPIKGRIDITLNHLPVDIVPVRIQPGQQWSTTLEKTSLEGGQLVARLTNIASLQDGDKPIDPKSDLASIPPPNHLAVDDVATAILPARSVQKVFIVSSGNLFLRKAFEANPLVELTIVEKLPATWPLDQLIVLHQLVPKDLPSGKLLVIDPANDSDAWKIESQIENPIITAQDHASPLMRHIQLDNVIVPQARKLSYSAPIHSLASTVSNDVIFAELTDRSMANRRLVLSVDLDSSDLAFRTSFPILISNILHWCSSDPVELLPAQATGSLLTLDLTRRWLELKDSQNLQLRSPEKNSQVVVPIISENADGTLRNVSCKLGPFDRVGVWNVIAVKESEGVNSIATESAVQSIAVNLSNEQESDTRYQQDQVPSPTVASFVGGYFSRPVWFYLAFLATLLFALEWFLYQRRVIS